MRCVVETVVAKYNHIDRDEHGDILSGGNLYIDVCYDQKLIDDIAANANLDHLVKDMGDGWFRVNNQCKCLGESFARERAAICILDDNLTA